MQRGTPAIQALHDTRVQLRAGKGNAASARGQQVARQRGTCFVLAKAHAIRRLGLPGIGQVHQMHARHLAAGYQGLGGGVVVQAGDQQAGRPVQQLLAQQLLFLPLVIVRHTDQGLKAAGPQGLLGGIEQVDKQGVGQLGDQDGHVVAALRGQGAGGRVGHVTELVGSRQHTLDQGRIDRSFSAQGPRHGDRADAGGMGHVVERDAAGGTMAFGRGGHGRQG